MSGRVVHVKDNVPGAIYIGRPNGRAKLKGSRWANSYLIGPDGGRREVVRAYRAELMTFLSLPERNEDYVLALSELRGKPLACWCRHDAEKPTAENICHGDVLIDILTQHTDEQLRGLVRGFNERAVSEGES